jgi:hypothetical protein
MWWLLIRRAKCCRHFGEAGEEAMPRFVVQIVLLSICCGGLLGCAGSSDPMPVTLQELIRTPDTYAMKEVRLRGQLDNCLSFSCHFCPEEMTDEAYDLSKCLALGFDDFSSSGGQPSVRTSELLEQAFRFAIITIDAKFDPTCLTNEGYRAVHEIKGKAETVVICTDRATVLRLARVQQVHFRKSALDGIVSWYQIGDLKSPGASDESEMRSASELELADFKGETRMFLVSGDLQMESGWQAEGLGCRCVEANCEGHWPNRAFLGFESPGNPFICWNLLKIKGHWQEVP